MTGPSSALRLDFRPDIEGLRGVAVALVVVYHAGLGLIPGGYVGVDVFFVLSGFLISWLLVEEAKRSGKVDLWAFYARRARRLLPAVAVLIVVTSVAAYWAYPPLEHRTAAHSALSAATYLSNFYFVYLVRDYFAPGADANPFLHTWSLSVEEQFYLVWPLLILLGLWLRNRWSMRERTALLSVMCAVLAMSLAASLVLAEYRLSWTFFLSPTRAWEFACGGVAALLARQWIESGRSITPLGRRVLEVMSCGCLAIIVASAWVLDDATPFPGYYALPPVLATAGLLYCCTIGRDLASGRVLSNPVLRRAGLVSYSWYLWHWPVFTLYAVAQGAPSALQSVVLLAISYVAAEASYRFVEAPARVHPFLAQSKTRSLLLIPALAALGAVIVGIQPLLPLGPNAGLHRELQQIRYVDGNPLLARDCVALQNEVSVRTCSFGVQESARDVVLLGDSHMAQWFPVLEELAKGQGWHLHTMIKTACPYADIAVLHEANKRPYKECSAWRADALLKIDELKPYLVVAASSFFYEATADDWRLGTTRTFARLSQASEHVVYIRDNPRPGFSVPACISRHLWRQQDHDAETCAFQREPAFGAEVFSAQVEAAQAFGNVQVIDLTAEICPAQRCPVMRDGQVIYRDSNHLSGSFVRFLQPPFDAQLMRALARDGLKP